MFFEYAPRDQIQLTLRKKALRRKNHQEALIPQVFHEPYLPIFGSARNGLAISNVGVLISINEDVH